MSFASDILPDLKAIRTIPDDMGMRPHTVSIVTGDWSGVHVGDGSLAAVTVPITPTPKVRWMNDEQIALSGLPKGSAIIGPITPSFPAFASLVGFGLSTHQTLHLRITGPQHPNGAIYRVTEAKAERSLRYMLTAQPVSL